MSDRPALFPGTVYLVGAGPGDPGLITVRGAEVLGRADTVMSDRLANESLLSLARPDAELLDVGKHPGEGGLSQAATNELMVAKARTGRSICRLKGGDPFVFGRGGEEAEALVDAGVPFEVVSGVTSALAAPAYAGIPVTHRAYASSFAVVTGHQAPIQPAAAIDWARLAAGPDTLVVLMGIENLELIVARLLAHGRAGGTPVAIVRWGTVPQQSTVVGTLADIVGRAREGDLRPPAVLIVGEVVRLRERLRWFDNRPLFGKRVLVTRSRHQASELSRLLAGEGAEPVELPTIRIAPVSAGTELDAALTGLAAFDWTIFTSVNGVVAAFDRLGELGADARAFSGVRVAALGAATASALAERGIRADLVPAVFTSEGTLEALRGVDLHGARVLLPRADIAGERLTAGLAARGALVTDVVAYRTVRPGQDAGLLARALARPPDVVTFTSSSTVTGLLDLLADDRRRLAGSLISCIGPVTASTARAAGLRVDVEAREHTVPGLVAALKEHLVADRAGLS